MTLEEFKSGNYVIEVSSYEGFVDCMRLMERLGFTWCNGKKFSEETLTCSPASGYWYYREWRNENGIIRYSDIHTAYYVIIDGNKISKKRRRAIPSNCNIIYSSDIASELGLDVDENGFEREFI